MAKRRKSVCIISFSWVAGDARVLRQVEYLSPHYDVTVVGEGEAHPSWPAGGAVTWRQIPPIRAGGGLRRLPLRLAGLALLLAGKAHPDSYLRWYWRQPIMRDTFELAKAGGHDAYHANDWNALPIAAEAATASGARLVFDAHEYAPLEWENRRVWRMLYSPMIGHVLRRYGPRADATTTVASAIADRYRREYGLDPVVVMNAPARNGLLPNREGDFNNIRLIHHGAAIPDRRLEDMIAALAECDRRYSLYFMLTGGESAYVRRLKRVAGELAAGRVTFLDPVATERVVEAVSEFDLGLCYIAPTNYNYYVSLPNKFFDFIAAGLPVCIGPSPSMAEVVRSYGLGCIARSFEPRDIAAALNSLGADELARMRRGARAAAAEVNAEREMGKLVRIYQNLLSGE
ncbi:MAG TPA: glycosyltransferase family 4 protein [Pyrinomonadaceae bacterium]|jgi:glycosyltransferase involved in cell wall biosynthesis